MAPKAAEPAKKAEPAKNNPTEPITVNNILKRNGFFTSEKYKIE